jgi:cbb3-type cytochrome oxidase subunit 3
MMGLITQIVVLFFPPFFVVVFFFFWRKREKAENRKGKGIREMEEWPARCVEVEMVVAVQTATLSLSVIFLLQAILLSKSKYLNIIFKYEFANLCFFDSK